MTDQYTTSIARLLALAVLAASIATLSAGCGGDGDDDGTSCQSDDDCSALDDGDRCNGVVRCVSGSCTPDDTPVICSSTLCASNACVPETGECVLSPKPDGTVCSDLNPCTATDLCEAGECVGSGLACEDDGDPCTAASCVPQTGECSHEPVPNFTECDDGDACTQLDTCVGGSCSGTPLLCEDDGNPCTEDACNPGGGDCLATPANDGATCDDGDSCTEDGVCDDGFCAAGAAKCASLAGPCVTVSCDGATGECLVEPEADGTSCEDGDLCTVGSACQGAECTGGTPKCEEGTDPCKAFVCSPATGACVLEPLAGSPPCDDGNPCTTGDACLAGNCIGSPDFCPEDGNPCTVTLCEDGKCSHPPAVDGLPCSDGEGCTELDACEDGECAGKPKCPDDGNSCTLETCDSVTGECGLIKLADGDPCDDDDPCTLGETCIALSCGQGDAKVCEDDGDPCTVELCVPQEGGCISVDAPDGSACDDGDPCTGDEMCTDGTCASDTLTVCPDDGDPCTVEACDPELGCTSTQLEDGTQCSDGDACTTSTTCKDGSCEGDPLDCAPSGPCFVAVCDAVAGCVESPVPDGQACEDGDPCTLQTSCTEGVCGGGTVKDCPQPGDPCLVGVCLPTTGNCSTTSAGDGTSCDDGDPCTTGDWCLAGVCTTSGPVDCGPGPDPCTDLVCSSAQGGCVPNPKEEGAACNAGNPCLSEGTCVDGECSSEPQVVCPDPVTPCTVAACDPDTGGCIELPADDGAACEDGQPCTQATTCLDGSCQGGEPTVCPDDGDSCSLEICVPGSGCGAAADEDGIPCDDSDPCTNDTQCDAGACGGGLDTVCPSDGDPCTSDACVPGEGCIYLPLGDGAPCDDGSLCTADDACEAGECMGEAVVSCPALDDPCLVNICQPGTGTCEPEASEDSVPCDDGNICTSSDACAQGVCVGEAVPCLQDTDPCTVAQCDPGLGACVLGPSSAGTPCDDGSICTSSDVCNGQGQCGGAEKECPPAELLCHVSKCAESTGACEVTEAPDGIDCQDSDLCSVGDFCVQGACIPGNTPACQASGACQLASCDPATGACTETAAADGAGCSDGDACTIGETCFAGDCGGGSSVVCTDDGNACTTTACNPTTGLCDTLAVPGGLPCDDGDACTSDDGCVDAACVGLPVTCPASEGCSVSDCNPATGDCESTPVSEGESCDDLDLCTSDELCTGGECVGFPVLCPDADTECLASVCQPTVGCVPEDANEGLACFDSVCEVDTTCTEGVCGNGTPLTCPPPGDPCLLAFCTDETGCATAPVDDGMSCDDGNACTGPGVCIAGSCEGQPIACVAPPCQVAVCDSEEGCTTAPGPDSSACDDGNPCTVGDLCQAGACEGGLTKVCGGSTCEPEICDPGSGACVTTTADEGTPCDDGNPCTEETGCVAGDCAGGTPALCPTPAAACFTAVCAPSEGGCVDVLVPDGSPCDDESACTADDTCFSGTCSGVIAVQCSPPNECLLSVCDPATGTCAPTLAPDGAACDDGEACTAGEICTLGECGGSAPATGCCTDATDCDDHTPCTADSCVAGLCAHAAVALEACVARIVVAGQADAELQLLDAETLTAVPGGTVDVNGLALQLASAPRGGVVFVAAAGNPFGVQAVDPLQPAQSPAVPATTTPAVALSVDDARGVLVVVHDDGGVAAYSVASGQETGVPANLEGTPGRAALDGETGRLFVPTSAGHLAVLRTDTPLSGLPATPWPVGGAPNLAAFDSLGGRIFLADAAGPVIRVLGATSGVGIDGDPIGGFGMATDLAVDQQNGRLLAAYPGSSVVRLFDLGTLLPGAPPAIAIGDAPASVTVDTLANRIYISGSGGSELHVLDATTLAPLPGSPLKVSAGPVDVVIFRSRPGPIIISEAMLDPDAVSDANGEWIELHNPGTVAVSLEGWTVETDFAFHTLGAGAPTVAAGGYAVLCRNTNPVENGGISCAGGYSGLPLSNDGTTLSLTPPSGPVADRARLTGPVPTGQTLALRHPAYDNGRRYSWSVSDGSPGAANTDVEDNL